MAEPQPPEDIGGLGAKPPATEGWGLEQNPQPPVARGLGTEPPGWVIFAK